MNTTMKNISIASNTLITRLVLMIPVLMLISSAAYTQAADMAAGEIVPVIPVTGTVTLVDLGARTCIPCKLMAPILEELKEEYKGRAEVIFIDVWDAANKEKAKFFKISSIPTQIFFDKKGREVYRHIGFLDKDAIAKKLEALLAE